VKILVLGSGGRENAIAWSLEWSHNAKTDEVIVAPGNAGSSRRVVVDVTDPLAVVEVCRRHRIELVVIGPESSLEAGVSDALRDAGFVVFAPSKAAAQLETSKTWCREFSVRHGIPGPQWKSFSGSESIDAAIAWADELAAGVVIKADGLMGGKGVVVPSSVAERDTAIRSASKGLYLLEERMSGEEVSLLVFTDGVTVRAMPPARDHKRLNEGDCGPNTGGMGVYAPSRLCPPAMTDEIIRSIVQPAVDGLREEGTPYVGVLYAGVMLTEAGPRLVEFNCRFGDPEAQAILPLLRTDLREILMACMQGTLDAVDVQWSTETSCVVVLASEGYPDHYKTAVPIHGLDEVALNECIDVFHCATEVTGSGIVTAGGRVLTVVATGLDLQTARARAYGAVELIGFDGMQFRRDIGWREIAQSTGGYAASGVNIDEGNRAVDLMKKKVEATHTPNVLGRLGGFGGSLLVSDLKQMDAPVLVSSTDGVGTKVLVASELQHYLSIGHDIVNHCVNDILVQRARPLFFLDYVASDKISATVIADIVSGMAEACTANDCVLIGGETAEMPGVYNPGHFDVAGTIVGVAERSRLLPLQTVTEGDVLIGLASSGLHTNGYSLVRRIFAGLPLEVVPEGFDVSLGEALLAPHRSYLRVLEKVLETDLVKGLVHITGGGFQENIPRILPDGCGAQISLGSWPRSALFDLIASVSGLDDYELHRTLNMGIGMIIVVAQSDAEAVRALIDEETWIIGSICNGMKSVELV
jgi:phosphoribosylamine--glycine ligase/phosphoribosylaminoimidazole synthetase